MKPTMIATKKPKPTLILTPKNKPTLKLTPKQTFIKMKMQPVKKGEKLC